MLKPLCKNIPSYIRDDLDFLKHIPIEVGKTTILVTFDVVSLYTSIPHDLGLDAIKFCLEHHNAFLPRKFSTEFILDAISIILHENTFQLDDKQFKQLQEAAMAPTYATLVIGFLEYILYKLFGDLYGHTDAQSLSKLFKRFLKDGVLLWNKSKQLMDFHRLLNSLHQKIHFTMECSTEKLPFLDNLLCKKENELYTDIFYKTTDTHQYLDYRSGHPKHTKNNIRYTLARRICRIIVEENLREKRLLELMVFLRKQNYQEGLIQKGIEEARTISVTGLRSLKEENYEYKILPIVITNNPKNQQVISKVKENLNFLKSSTKMKTMMDETKLIISRRPLQPHYHNSVFTSIEPEYKRNTATHINHT